MQETKIPFSAQDNGISSFMKRLQADTKSLYGEIAKEAQKQTNSSKEQLKIIEAQIKALKEQNKLEQEQNRIILDRKRSSGIINDKQFSQGFGQIREDASVNKHQVSLLNQMLEEMKKNTPDDKPIKPADAKSVFGAILGAGILRDLFGLVKQSIGASSEFDLITPSASIAGSLIGTGFGSLAEAATLGQIEYATIGAQTGKDIGGFMGAGYTRHLKERERYLSTSYRISGLTGQSSQAGSLSQFGIDMASAAQLEEHLVMARRSAVTGRDVKDVAALSKAYTVDTGSVAEYLGTSRMGTNANVRQIVGALAEGINRSQLGDFIKSTTSLVTMMGQTSMNPSLIGARQMVLEHNRLGGAFGIADPRSLGLISSIQSDITNPSSPFAQAMSYSILRQMNPDKGIVDLMIEQKKGGASLESGNIERIKSMFGNEDMQTLALMNIMPSLQGNPAVARSLLRGSENVSAGGREILANDVNMTELYGRATSLTTTISQGQAAVTDAFVTSMTEGISVLAVRFTNLMTKAIDDAVAKRLGGWGSTNGKSANKNGQPEMNW